MYAVYVTTAGDRRIHVMQLDPTNGKISPIEVVEVPGPDTPKPISLPLALSPDHRHLYAAIRMPPYPASAFAIDGTSGRLKLIGSANLTDGMCHLSVDNTGRFLLAASYTGSSLTVAPIGADARIGAPTAFFSSPGAHCVIPWDADDRFAYVAGHGGDEILQFELDRARGTLVEARPRGLPSSKGAGPRHIIIHTPSKRMYAVNEKNGTVDMLAIDLPSGNLRHLTTVTMLPAGYDAVSSASDIHITQNGRFLYASERTGSFLVSYAVDAERETLTPIEWVDTETCPRGFTIDPSDRFLLSAGELSGGMTVYAIDQADGKLSKTDRVAIGPCPTWIEVLGLP
jgi:6-phosphogluconolactonase